MGSIYGYSEGDGPRKKAKLDSEEPTQPVQSAVSLPGPPQPRAVGPRGTSLTTRTSPEQLQMAMNNIVDLKVFLFTAPATFKPGDILQRFHLPTTDEVSCVRWNNFFYMTGTDIVRCLTYRFLAFGRSITNKKKFEEGVFSDLRNLKNNMDATLESPRSEFLEFLYKNRCVRTKKKQKVFFWFSVHHERLFIDALERDLRKECAKTSEAATTKAISEPALSFKFDPDRSLKDQIHGILGNLPTPLAAIAKATFTGNTQQPMYTSFNQPLAPLPTGHPPSGHPGQGAPGSAGAGLLGVPSGAPGAGVKRNVKLPPTPVFGSYPPAQEGLDDGLDVDFFKDSDFPLDLLRKEDLKAGNTPTTAHFPGYVDELYDYGRDQQRQQYMMQGSQIPPYDYSRGYMVQHASPAAPAPAQVGVGGQVHGQGQGQGGQGQGQGQQVSMQAQQAQHPQQAQQAQQAQQMQVASFQAHQMHMQHPQQMPPSHMHPAQQQMMPMQMQAQYPYIMVPYSVPQGGNN